MSWRLIHIVYVKQVTELQMKVEAELNLHNTAIIIDHCQFLCSGRSLKLKVFIQGDTVHCVQNNVLEIEQVFEKVL